MRQLAQPDGGAGRLGHRHVRPPDPAGRRQSSRRSPRPRTSTRRLLRGRHPHRRRCSTTSRRDDDRSVHTASYGVTLLDFGTRAPLGAFSAPRMLEMAQARSERNGVITAESLGAVFSWMRPDDLVFNYVGQQLAPGRTPAGLRHPGVERRRHEPAGARCTCSSSTSSGRTPWPRRAAVRVLDTPVDLGRITVPMFVTGRGERPPHALDRLLPDHRAALGAEHVRAQQLPATSPASSTLPATRRPATGSAANPVRVRTNGVPAPRNTAAIGGSRGGMGEAKRRAAVPAPSARFGRPVSARSGTRPLRTRPAVGVRRSTARQAGWSTPPR